MLTKEKYALERSVRRHIAAGLFAMPSLFVVGISWAAVTELASAVVVPGQFVANSYVKKVQHPTGGVVAAILVREGQKVDAGQVVMRLDATQTRAGLAIVAKRRDELGARLARLEAERDDKGNIQFPKWLRGRTDDPEVSAALQSETNLFEFRVRSRKGKQAQLRERIVQLEYEIKGLRAQEMAYQIGADVLREEIASLKRLREQQIVSDQRLNSLKTQLATFDGERGEKMALQAQVAVRISETRLQILQIEQDFKTEVAQELREVQTQLGEVTERWVAAEDQLKRVDIVAPQSGFVHQMSVHTVGGVVTSAEPVMLIVPADDEKTLEVRVHPKDIDQVHVGQRAKLRLSAFNLRTTPELDGKLEHVAADLTTDPKSGAAYYIARISVSQAELKGLEDLTVVPGMPAEALIQTGERSVLSYLIKPLSDQVVRAFRET